MAHFAQLDENNRVTQVIVVGNDKLLNEQGVEEEARGITFCESLLGGRWIQTSYNGSFRERFAGIDYIYVPEADAFFSPKPYASWVLDLQTKDWKAPKPMPEAPAGQHAEWNEDIQDWYFVDNDIEPDGSVAVEPTVL